MVREKKKVAPMDFGLAEGDIDAEDGAFAIGADADGDKHGAVADLGGTDLMAAEFLNDFGDFAGGDALNIHLLHCVHPSGAACRLAIFLRSVRPWPA